jgi:hypothetical protein
MTAKKAERTKRPNSVRNLDNAIRRVAGQEGYVAARTLVANALVATMLPEGAVKGGTSLKLRFGEATTRYTTDLDAARAGSVEDFRQKLADRLAGGWEGFSGRVVEGRQAHPKDVPAAYVMQPFEVKISYLGKPWCTVALEVGHDEIGDADTPEMVEPTETNALLVRLGFPALPPVPVMPLSYQIAQKLHGVTGPGSARAHDLIDLQVIVANSGDAIDWREVRRTCERLFAYRKMQTWPPTVVAGPSWDTLYADQVLPEPVKQTVGEAVEWANGLVARIASA